MMGIQSVEYPVPIERAQQACAIRCRQIHQHVHQHADGPGHDEHAERRMAVFLVIALRIEVLPSRPHHCSRQQAKADNSERTVRRAPMPGQISSRSSQVGDDVEVRRVRSDDERCCGSRPARPRGVRARVSPKSVCGDCPSIDKIGDVGISGC